MKRKLMALMLAGIMVIQSAGTSYGQQNLQMERM